MSDLFAIGRGARRLAMPMAGIAVLAYLSYHAFIGDRGLATHARLIEEAQVLEDRLATLKRRRARMEKRIALLSDKSLNEDMLDERARAVLNFVHPDEVTILSKMR